MATLLGIDTGGTYTDAVLLDDEKGVIGFGKSLTTQHNLYLGIRSAVESALLDPFPEINLVSLSTTLATNAVVEGQGSPICLLLLGYPPDALHREGLSQALGSDPVVFITGGHTITGGEQMPLDLDAVRQAIITYAGRSAAFAVSGYLGVYNPSHELAVRNLVRELTGLPVTCGHELTSNLNAPRRALTVVLNARLIPLLQQLIQAVQDMLLEKSIHAPLMVVKGDGSLINASVALEYPVETILSGPAASVVGARYLSGIDDVFVADMGGTTTDIAILRAGQSVLNEDGAIIGGWKTMVEAVSVHTYGLGGDSQVTWTKSGDMLLGPVRVVPLSLLAHQYPAVITTLHQQVSQKSVRLHYGQFALRQRPLDVARENLTAFQTMVWEALADGPLALDLLLDSEVTMLKLYALKRLAERGLVIIGGFTPTDAAHVLGYVKEWSLEGAQLGAELLVRQASAFNSEKVMRIRDICLKVMHQMTIQAGRAIVSSALAEGYHLNLNDEDSLGRLLIDQALAGQSDDGTLVKVNLSLCRPLVAIGAPVHTYYPAIAEKLHTRLVIPEHAEIANAIGAVASSVMQTVRAFIKPLGQEIFRVHLPTGIQDFNNIEKAVAYATESAGNLADAHARHAGASAVQIKINRKDQIVDSDNGIDHDGFFLSTEIKAIAIGRPKLACISPKGT
ncbi:MAG: hypothetical protein APR62_09330 [Smithella sp. SDB]|nr:MAG: hypothetical protein APR62_09330 [Smithella sp. SDB]